MKIKCGKRDFLVTTKDRILDNGACYILITQYYLDGYFRCHPTVAKATFKRLQKEDKIELCANKYEGRYDLYKFVEA